MVESIAEFAAFVRENTQKIASGQEPERPWEARVAGQQQAAESVENEGDEGDGDAAPTGRNLTITVPDGEEPPIVEMRRSARDPKTGKFRQNAEGDGEAEGEVDVEKEVAAEPTAEQKAAATTAKIKAGNEEVSLEEIVQLRELRRQHEEGITTMHSLMRELEAKEAEVTQALPQKLAEADAAKSRFASTLAQVNKFIQLANTDPAAFVEVARQFPNGLRFTDAPDVETSAKTSSGDEDDDKPLTRAAFKRLLEAQDAEKQAKAAKAAEEQKAAARTETYNKTINEEIDRLAGNSRAMKRLMLGHISLAQSEIEPTTKKPYMHEGQGPDVLKYLVGKVFEAAKADLDAERGLAGHKPSPNAKKLPPATKAGATPVVAPRKPRNQQELKQFLLEGLNARSGVVRG